MSNEEYLNNIKSMYISLKPFDIKNNNLIFNDDKLIYMCPLTNINLSSLNTHIFLLDSKDIFQIIYMIELIYKNNLNENEIEFIKKYTKRYIELDGENKQNNNIDTNFLWCLSIPIFFSYDVKFENNNASQLIRTIMNDNLINTQNDNDNGRNNVKTLVLTKGKDGNYLETEDNEDENFKNLKDAGFTTFFLIIGATLATCFYMLYFYASK